MIVDREPRDPIQPAGEIHAVEATEPALHHDEYILGVVLCVDAGTAQCANPAVHRSKPAPIQRREVVRVARLDRRSGRCHHQHGGFVTTQEQSSPSLWAPHAEMCQRTRIMTPRLAPTHSEGISPTTPRLGSVNLDGRGTSSPWNWTYVPYDRDGQASSPAAMRAPISRRTACTLLMTSTPSLLWTTKRGPSSSIAARTSTA